MLLLFKYIFISSKSFYQVGRLKNLNLNGSTHQAILNGARGLRKNYDLKSGGFYKTASLFFDILGN